MDSMDKKWSLLLHLLVQWCCTSDPKKKFPLEIQLMGWGAKHSRWLRKRFQRRIFYVYNCDISHMAKISSSVTFPHPTGIVIGSNAIVGDRCSIYQQVTIGGNFDQDNSMAHLMADTRVGTGAKIIGGITIGEQCIVGANAVVTKNTPSNSMIVGVNKLVQK